MANFLLRYKLLFSWNEPGQLRKNKIYFVLLTYKYTMKKSDYNHPLTRFLDMGTAKDLLNNSSSCSA